MKGKLLFLSCISLLLLTSCQMKNSTEKTWFKEGEVVCGSLNSGYIGAFTQKMVVLDSSEQIQKATALNADFAKEFNSLNLTELYPIEEYIYFIQYVLTYYETEKVAVNGMYIHEPTKKILFDIERSKSILDRERDVVDGVILYGVISRDVLVNYDYSNAMGFE